VFVFKVIFSLVLDPIKRDCPLITETKDKKTNKSILEIFMQYYL